MRLEELFESEGVDPEPPSVREVDGNTIINNALFLFGFIPEPDDPRWIIINAYSATKKSTKFRPVTFESALSGIYLSEAPSYRNGYGRWGSLQNLRQLSRAIVSMDMHGALRSQFEKIVAGTSVPADLAMDLARTNRILKGSDQQGITGCPEAAYQLRMFQGRKYLGRIGFNAHREREAVVLSVTNIQGVPGAREQYDEISGKLGKQPHNFMVNLVTQMAGELSLPTSVRGLKNPAKVEARPFYNKVFKTEGIDRVSFERRSKSV